MASLSFCHFKLCICFFLTFFLVWISLFLNPNICFLAWQTRLHPRWWEEQIIPLLTLSLSLFASLSKMRGVCPGFLSLDPARHFLPSISCVRCCHASIVWLLSIWQRVMMILHWRRKLWPCPGLQRLVTAHHRPKVTVIRVVGARTGQPRLGPRTSSQPSSDLRSHGSVGEISRIQAHRVIQLSHHILTDNTDTWYSPDIERCERSWTL